MSLQYLETNVLGGYLMDAWQNHLQTERDPTAGKWFRQGPNNSAGLFGGLTDVLVTDLVFDTGSASVNRGKDVAVTTTLDNRTGLLNDSPATTTLAWQVQNSSTCTQSKTNSIKTSLSEKVSVKGTIKLVEVVSVTTLSFEYAYSWTDTKAVTQTDTKTFTASVPLKVPQGKAYKLVVLADRCTASLPYHARVRIKGTSQANFAAAINGQTQFTADAGTICSWIKQYGSAGDDQMEFDADPAAPTEGLASIRGMIRVDQSVNFTVYAIDVTSTLSSDPASAGAIKRLIDGQPLPSDQMLSAQPIAA